MAAGDEVLLDTGGDKALLDTGGDVALLEEGGAPAAAPNMLPLLGVGAILLAIGLVVMGLTNG